MIGQRSFVRPIGPEETWSMTINTEAATVGGVQSQIPISLYNSPSYAFVDISWGDGQTTRLTSADYNSADDVTATLHTYAEAGIYTIEATSRNWSDIWLIGDGNADTSVMLPLRNTLVQLVSKLPRIKGTLEKHTDNTISFMENELNYVFFRCPYLTQIPDNLFSRCKHIIRIHSLFRGCLTLSLLPSGLLAPLVHCRYMSAVFRACPLITTIPTGFFDNNVELGSCLQMFMSGGLQSLDPDLFLYNNALDTLQQTFALNNALGDFTLNITSRLIKNADNFVTLKAEATRTIYVPSGSTTETTFNTVASNLGLTVIGE